MDIKKELKLDDLVAGYRIIAKAKGGIYIPTIEKRFNDLYRVKHFDEFLQKALDSENLNYYFIQRNETFKRYCSRYYGTR